MRGERGYGLTHSQTLQKHFIGILNFHIFEMFPFHDNVSYIVAMFDAGVVRAACGCPGPAKVCSSVGTEIDPSKPQ